ncbi:MAG: hypothetical protein V4675_24705 [Verrucomicrobiota bacterium]
MTARFRKLRAIFLPLLVILFVALWFFNTEEPGRKVTSRHGPDFTPPKDVTQSFNPKPFSVKPSAGVEVAPKPVVLKQNSRNFKKALKVLHLDPSVDLIGEFLSGQRDKEKFLRARTFLQSLGVNFDDNFSADELAALFAFEVDTDSPEWRAKIQKMAEQIAEARRRNPWLAGTADAAKLAAEGNNPALLLASIIDPNGGYTGEGSYWLLANALKDNRFLDDPAVIDALRNGTPESAWGSLLSARRAIESGDWDTALSQVPEMLSRNLEPTTLGTREALADFLMKDRGYDYAKAQAGRASGFFDVEAHEFTLLLALDFYDEARKRQAIGDPKWVDIATRGMALAELGGESLDSSQRETSLSSQKSFLQELGKEKAQEFLQEPFDQVINSIENELELKTNERIASSRLMNSLSPGDQQSFSQMLRQLGDTRALAQWKAKQAE